MLSPGPSSLLILAPPNPSSPKHLCPVLALSYLNFRTKVNSFLTRIKNRARVRKLRPTSQDWTTTSSHGSNDASSILQYLCTPASILFGSFDNRPSISSPTFPPTPRRYTRLLQALPSAISVANLDTEEDESADMDKRHPRLETR